MNIQDTWKKSALSLRLRFDLNFLEFFKCSTNSNSVICRKRNVLMLTFRLRFSKKGFSLYNTAFDI